MFTSYFSKLSQIKNPVSICGAAPDFYKGPQYKILAPKKSFFYQYKSGIIDDVGYIEEYYRLVLNSLDPNIVYNYLINKYGEDVTLICYEKPGDFCHRRVVADWFETNLGIKVNELTFDGSSSGRTEDSDSSNRGSNP